MATFLLFEYSQMPENQQKKIHINAYFYPLRVELVHKDKHAVLLILHQGDVKPLQRKKE